MNPVRNIVILTGAGRAFSAGGDLKGMAQRVGTPANFRHALRAPANTRRLWQNMIELQPPLIAAINGDAMGLGCSLALFCDITDLTTISERSATVESEEIAVLLAAHTHAHTGAPSSPFPHRNVTRPSVTTTTSHPPHDGGGGGAAPSPRLCKTTAAPFIKLG